MVNGSRAAAPKGTMFCIKTSISTPSDLRLEAGGQRLEARSRGRDGYHPNKKKKNGDFSFLERKMFYQD